MRPHEDYNFERVIRKYVKIACPACSYYRGVKNEKGIVKCGECGAVQ